MYFKNSNGICPNKNQDFMWVADYADGSHLAEFENNKESSFYAINKNNLIYFGIVGCGHKMYFDVMSGTFEISGRKIELEYIDENDNIYKITGSNVLYNDILQFKEAESNFNPTDIYNRKVNTNILQFNFGYKQKLNFENTNINAKIICKIPYNSPVYLEITLTSSKQLNGKLIIKRNGNIIDAINAPLHEGMKGTINWDII